MPDILDLEKSEIREKARNFALNLWKVPFNEGLLAYVKSSNELYINSARWKYCLKCGEIKKKESLENHGCLMDVGEFPILIQTSWYKLKEFFLSDKYKSLLKEIGIHTLPEPSVVVEIKEMNVEDKAHATAAEKGKS